MRQRLPSRPPIESTAAGLTSTEASRPCGKTQVNHLKAGDGLSITLASWAFHSMRICVDVLDADGMESRVSGRWSCSDMFYLQLRGAADGRSLWQN
jgi:hypothetical protein